LNLALIADAPARIKFKGLTGGGGLGLLRRLYTSTVTARASIFLAVMLGACVGMAMLFTIVIFVRSNRATHAAPLLVSWPKLNPH